ncbi:MAG: hypothetical protein HY219_00270 [Candidatus Staskawiczbacteria bacterium]|nr:hypothetical protein [Candidatus Staskawiczbacteria bacterium]
MNSLFEQLGINWKLFLSQAVNFFILLVVLRAFVYKPLLIVIKERNKKIKEGLEKAEEASIRLKEIDIIAKNKLKQADQESMDIIKKTEKQAKILGDNLQKKAEDHQKELMEQIQISYKKQQEEARSLVYQEATELVKKAIKRTVELSPKEIDDALIKKVALKMKNNEI